MPTVEVNVKGAPVGADVEVPYLGLLKNGEVNEVSQKHFDRFVKNQPGASQFEGKSSIKIPVLEHTEVQEQPTTQQPSPGTQTPASQSASENIKVRHESEQEK